jgi:hypothetical protein
LLKEYSDSRREYSDLAREMSDHVSGTDHVAYLKLQEQAEAARLRVEHAQLVYGKHLIEHGCFQASPEGRPRDDSFGKPLISAASQYEGQLIRRPGSTAEDQKVYIVRNGVKQWIVDRRWVTSHGYRWPDDVKTIPASELDAIPLGDTIQ